MGALLFGNGFYVSQLASDHLGQVKNESSMATKQPVGGGLIRIGAKECSGLIRIVKWL